MARAERDPKRSRFEAGLAGCAQRPLQIFQIEGETGRWPRRPVAPEQLVVATAGPDRLARTRGEQVEAHACVIRGAARVAQVEAETRADAGQVDLLDQV